MTEILEGRETRDEGRPSRSCGTMTRDEGRKGLDVLLKGFSKEKTEEIFGKTKEALAWLTRELKKQ